MQRGRGRAAPRRGLGLTSDASSRSIAGVVPAGGLGRRAGSGPPKQFRNLSGVPVLVRSVKLLRDAGCGRVIAAVPGPHLEEARAMMTAAGLDVVLVTGGPTRADSVMSALEQVDDDIVVVHDAARPFATPDLVRRVVAALDGADGAVAALPMDETVKRAEDRSVIHSVDRSGLWRAQTPQAFWTGILAAAHRERDPAVPVTDDAMLVEARGGRVRLVEGERSNLKLTYEEDFVMAGKILRGEVEDRIGHGYDVHAFEEGRPLVLGGVRISYDRGLGGHSDADVVAHAAADALLGAAALGDLGSRFPATERWAGASGAEILSATAELVREAGWRISNVDVTIIAQEPALAGFRTEMERNTAEALGVGVERVSVKATTTDRLGALGRAEGIAAQAVALLRRP